MTETFIAFIETLRERRLLVSGQRAPPAGGAVRRGRPSLLTHSRPRGTRLLLGVRTAFESHEIEAPSSRWWLCFPKRNKLLLKEFEFSLLFFFFFNHEGPGAKMLLWTRQGGQTPRGTDGLVCGIQWWPQNGSVKVHAGHWLQERPRVLGLCLVPVLLPMCDSHLLGQTRSDTPRTCRGTGTASCTPCPRL